MTDNSTIKQSLLPSMHAYVAVTIHLPATIDNREL